MVKARVHPDTNVISVYKDGFADNETGKTPTVEGLSPLNQYLATVNGAL